MEEMFTRFYFQTECNDPKVDTKFCNCYCVRRMCFPVDGVFSTRQPSTIEKAYLYVSGNGTRVYPYVCKQEDWEKMIDTAYKHPVEDVDFYFDYPEAVDHEVYSDREVPCERPDSTEEE